MDAQSLRLFAQNIRSLSQPIDVELKPLTILTGENSAGKSTFLAIATLALDFDFPLRVDFNIPSFDLGGYETIATNKGNGTGVAPFFSMGYRLDLSPQFWKEVQATFEEHKGGALLTKISVKARDLILDLNRDKAEKDNWLGKLNVRSRKYELKGSIDFSPSLDSAIFALISPEDRAEFIKSDDGDYRIVRNSLVGFPGMATPMAPLRTRPRRTYDRPILNFTPEGDHIPYRLALELEEEEQTFPFETSPNRLISALRRFGEESGLFHNLHVNRFGKSNADPFQIQVYVHDKPFNLVDVGYGVSQVLPILVESVLSEEGMWMFVQQPEVHLHPKAQAALGSFLVDLAGNGNKSFVIETHSDYIIDRVRLEIARGNIPASDVQILFFDRNGYDTTIHQLLLDEFGNILNAPPNYRSFFLQEESQLFNRNQIDVSNN